MDGYNMEVCTLQTTGARDHSGIVCHVSIVVIVYIYTQLTGSQSSRESSLSAMGLSVEGYFFFSFFFLFPSSFLQMIARENEGRRKKKKNPPDNLAVASELHPI